ncbi:MAG: carboxypeptidase-like regulatory domain-containing protein, partial [Candidatus Bathyarchaeia archaeon]
MIILIICLPPPSIKAESLGEVRIGAYGPGESPIAGASVILYDHESGGWIADGITDESGIVVMNVSTEIAFDVLIYETGYGEIENGREIGFYFDSNSGMGYTAPCNVNFTLQSGISSGILSGVVSDAVSSSPVEGAMVSIAADIQGRTYVVKSVLTLSDGSYSADLNVGDWRVWIDKKVDGETLYLGTWHDAEMTSGDSVTLDASLWPKATLTIQSLTSTEGELDYVAIMLINDTYGGLIWRADLSASKLPREFDVPAVNSFAVLLSKTFTGLCLQGSVEVPLESGDASINSVLYPAEYMIWCFPNDWEMERLLGNLTLEIQVVTPESAKPKGPDGGGPPKFIDPDGSISQYIMLDVGGGIPTTWCKMATPTKTDVGNYFGFFDLNALEAPQGYYMTLTVIRNSTGNAVAANFVFFNRFQYQIQPLQLKGVYDVGEDVECKFKVYGSSGYISDAEVSYRLFNVTEQWNFITGGFATVNSSTKVWSITIPSSDLSPGTYRLSVKISGGREFFADFKVEDYASVTFSGQILPNASINLFSEQQGTFVVTADQTGSFNLDICPGDYNAWFHYDNKNTPGWDARDTNMQLTLTNDVVDFPSGFTEYQNRPMQPIFEVRGVAFNDTNQNGMWDSDEERLALVNVRGVNMTGWEEWGPPTFPDGTYRLFLKPGAVYKLRATKTIYMQNETATPKFGEGTKQGNLLILNIPMTKMSPGYITGYVKLENGTLLENVGLNFMDEYWTWIGSTFTNSTGGYLFTAPANKKMNVWVDPMRPGVRGKDIRGIIVAEGETLTLNVTLYQSARVNGTIQMNGTDVWAQILPLDENWNRVWWEWGETGHFETEIPLCVKRLMFLSWCGYGGFLIKDVSLAQGVTSDLGVITLTPNDPNLMVDAHPKGWEWDWSVGHYVNFTVEVRNAGVDYSPISDADITYWAWCWDTGELAGHGEVNELQEAPGIYEGAFLASKPGHYR